MPTVEQLRTRLIDKLKELFQLDQPDLDFGFYRIMHAKSKQVTEFLENDLLKIVEAAFTEGGEPRIAALRKEYEDAIAKAKEFGATDPEATEPVKKAKAALDAAADTSKAEAEVYDHLYRFFERYYEDGDFISRRYYRRETDSHHPPFGIPYYGEEVKLHWANADQYYIKTAEHFSNYTFDLTKSKEVDALKLELFGEEEPEPRLVHFRIVAATEGEHGNVKAGEQSKRYFIIHDDDPVAMKDGELVVSFYFRPDPDKTGQDGTWRDKRNAESVEAVIAKLESIAEGDDIAAEYLRLLRTPAPTDKHADRPVLARYINQYTARNTMDYFIHKDLGGFLRRELDFYVKNEVVRLDDIESAEVAHVDQYLGRLKVLRHIAGKLIEFLAQLEDFQKRLWQKKKFVIGAGYCLTLDRVPEVLYPDILANDLQRDEWVRLFAVDDIAGDLATPAYSQPLTVEFLKANPYLVLDTRLFDDVFVSRLLESIDNLDSACNGVLINADNAHALTLLRARYGSQVTCMYIDPPYNTGEDEFVYKDAYQHSSWATFIDGRIAAARSLLASDGLFFSSIDFVEEARLRELLDQLFGADNFLCKVIWEKRFTRSNNAKLFSTLTENILAYRSSSAVSQLREPRSAKADSTYSNPDDDPRGVWTSVSYVNPASKEARPNLVYPLRNPITGEEVNHPTNAWKYERSVYERHVAENRLYWGRDGGHTYPRLKKFLSEMEGMVPVDLWKHEDTGTTDSASKLLEAEFGKKVFDFPKPPSLIRRIIGLAGFGTKEGVICDFFAGTGPTGHAVINMNREDGGTRQYILVEMGKHFEAILCPRMKKIVYAQKWQSGRPTTRDAGMSHCFKIMRLESYEDTLNNLRLGDAPAGAVEMGSEYLVRYALDIETQGSPSLLCVDAFADPLSYSLRAKNAIGDGYESARVDLVETWNYLLGVRVEHIAAPQSFTAEFKRERDPDLPEDQNTRLVIDGRIRQDANGPWWFRKVEGWIPKDFKNPNNGEREKVLIVWRKCPKLIEMGPEGLEYDNAVLDAWFEANRINPREKYDFDIIYVNCSNNLPNLALEEETWRVRLIEEDFHKLMWDVDDV